MSVTPLRVALTVIRHANASILKCTHLTCDGRHRYCEIYDDKNVEIDFKSTLRVGDTLVPMNFISNGTHFLNFAGGKKEWHVYKTIGNLFWEFHQMPSTYTIIMVALLPSPIRTHNIF
jgi:hypothetical protein